MMIQAQQMMSDLKKLGSVTSSRDIQQLTYAMFPGTHCPLMGAAMAVRGIQKAVLLVIGTDECAYYTKHMTLHSEEFGGVQGRCVSAVLDTRDVTFGCKEKLDAAVAELMEEYQPPAVFLVTTCVVEIIGDDMDAMAQMYTKQYGIPFLSVHTEHFKCENHLPGIERTMSACFEMMRPQEKNNTVNILGQRMGRFETTELYRILTESGIKIGMQLPCGCSVEEIIQAPSAGVNLVLDETALPLARKMKEAFGTPYIRFERFIDPQRIWEAYQMLFDALQRELPPQLEENYKKAQKCVEQVKEKLFGIGYIYGNTPFHCLELNAFLCRIGMIPQLIQTAQIEPEQEKDYLQEILSKTNPYVTKSANIAPLQSLYDVLHPHLYLGHEYPARLRKKGMAVVRCDAASSMLGFEVTEFMLSQLANATEEAHQYRKEVGLR